MANILQFLPSLEGEEMFFIQNILKDMDDTKAQQFATVYISRRKDPTMILIMALVGFLGLAGIHRFVLGNIGLGILYLFTAGLCLIGTVVDLVNYKKLTFEYNQKVAQEVMMMMKSFS